MWSPKRHSKKFAMHFGRNGYIVHNVVEKMEKKWKKKRKLLA
jgi:hypothetical protein